MTNISNLQADISLDFDTEERAKVRRQRRSSIFEKSRFLMANLSGTDEHSMDVDSPYKDYEKCYIANLEKEIEDWKSFSRMSKNQLSISMQNLSKGDSKDMLNPRRLLNEEEKEFLKGAEIYQKFAEKLDQVTEAFAIAEKLQQNADEIISKSVEKLESKFSATIRQFWLKSKDEDYINELFVASENINLDNLPYQEPFLQDLSTI